MFISFVFFDTRVKELPVGDSTFFLVCVHVARDDLSTSASSHAVTSLFLSSGALTRSAGSRGAAAVHNLAADRSTWPRAHASSKEKLVSIKQILIRHRDFLNLCLNKTIKRVGKEHIRSMPVGINFC